MVKTHQVIPGVGLYQVAFDDGFTSFVQGLDVGDGLKDVDVGRFQSAFDAASISAVIRRLLSGSGNVSLVGLDMD